MRVGRLYHVAIPELKGCCTAAVIGKYQTENPAALFLDRESNLDLGRLLEGCDVSLDILPVETVPLFVIQVVPHRSSCQGNLYCAKMKWYKELGASMFVTILMWNLGTIQGNTFIAFKSFRNCLKMKKYKILLQHLIRHIEFENQA